jgi:hypothetical protein
METEKTIRQIIIIYWAIWGTMMVMFAVAIVAAKITVPIIDWTASQRETLKSVIIILSLGGIPASYFFHNQKIKHIPTDKPLGEKIRQFKTSFFIKIATLESLAILGLLGYMLSLDTAFLYIFGLLFLAYIINRPTKRNIFAEFESEENEKDSSS